MEENNLPDERCINYDPAGSLRRPIRPAPDCSFNRINPAHPTQCKPQPTWKNLAADTRGFCPSTCTSSCAERDGNLFYFTGTAYRCPGNDLCRCPQRKPKLKCAGPLRFTLPQTSLHPAFLWRSNRHWQTREKDKNNPKKPISV